MRRRRTHRRTAGLSPVVGVSTRGPSIARVVVVNTVGPPDDPVLAPATLLSNGSAVVALGNGPYPFDRRLATPTAHRWVSSRAAVRENV